MPIRIRSRVHSLALSATMVCAPLSLPVFVCCAGAKASVPTATYPDAKGLSQRLEGLERSHRKIARRHRLSDSSTGEAVWLLELGRGSDEDRNTRPALLVVAGIEGDDPFGTSVTLNWAEQLASRHGQDPAVTKLLDEVTLYVVPRVNLEAAESMFQSPQVARPGGLRASDDDRDGLLDEDPPEDLDKDGKITWMRIEDPEGTYILDEQEPRLLMQAKASDGERGQWRYLPEGVDNDGDERWNEDPVGGVNLNRNFPYEYAWFAADAGTHQVSEPETRALADFVIAHPNIAAAFTFGRSENLASACPDKGGRGMGQKRGGNGKGDKAGAGAGRGRAGGRRGGRRGRWSREATKPTTSIEGDDKAYLTGLADRYREALQLSWGLDEHKEPGNFADWMYFHRGRMSLSTVAWSPKLQFAIDEVGKPVRPGCGAKKSDDDGSGSDAKATSTDSAAGEGESGEGKPGDGEPDKGKRDKGKPGDGEPDKGKRDKGKRGKGRHGDGSGSNKNKDERNRDERAFLAWADEHSPATFVEWKPIEHPDFPGQRVEVGGFVPYADKLPPPDKVEPLQQKYAAFLTDLAGQLPRVAVRKIETTHLGAGVYDVKIQVENSGYLPTALSQGEATREVHPTRLELDLKPEQILAGTRSTPLPPLAGSGGMHEVHYTLFLGSKRKVDVQVISMIAGTAWAVIDTKGAR